MLTPLHPTVAFKWPSASTAQLIVSIRHITDPAPQSLEFRRVLSADSKHKRQPREGLTVTTNPRGFVNWRRIASLTMSAVSSTFGAD